MCLQMCNIEHRLRFQAWIPANWYEWRWFVKHFSLQSLTNKATGIQVDLSRMWARFRRIFHNIKSINITSVKKFFKKSANPSTQYTRYPRIYSPVYAAQFTCGASPGRAESAPALSSSRYKHLCGRNARGGGEGKWVRREKRLASAFPPDRRFGGVGVWLGIVQSSDSVTRLWVLFDYEGLNGSLHVVCFMYATMTSRPMSGCPQVFNISPRLRLNFYVHQLNRVNLAHFVSIW